MLSGEVTLYDGTSWVRAGAGDHLLVPEGGVHGFRNDTDAPAAMLMMSTPGGAFAEQAEVWPAGGSSHLRSGPRCTRGTTR